MYRKLFITIVLVLSCSLLCLPFAYADDNNAGTDLKDGVRNVVNDVEGAVENGAKDVSNASLEATNTMEHDTNHNMGDDNSNNNGNYTATRTSAEGEATFMGMTSTAWTWAIIGIAAIVIVALVWYYGSTTKNSSND